MPFEKYPSKMFFRTLDTGEELRLGTVELPAAASNTRQGFELRHLRLALYKHGAHGGSEQLRVRIYPNADHATPVHTSDWLSLSSITTLSTYWLGWLRFDFARAHLWGLTYHVTVQAQNYTRNGDSYYLGFKFDWPDRVNSVVAGAHGLRIGAQMGLVGYQ